MNPTLEIETACSQLAHARAELRRRYELHRAAVSALESEHSHEFQNLQDRCAALRATLASLIEHARPCFAKPKTREFHGIVVGFEKTRDTLTLPDETLLVQRIEKMLPAPQGETVLDRRVRIIKAAFKKLPRATLQKLGCAFISGGDQVIVRAQDDDIENLLPTNDIKTPVI